MKPMATRINLYEKSFTEKALETIGALTLTAGAVIFLVMVTT